jgi:hypothetical protein
MRLAAQAPCRWCPLSSNVRPSGYSAGPAQETRTRQLTTSLKRQCRFSSAGGYSDDRNDDQRRFAASANVGQSVDADPANPSSSSRAHASRSRVVADERGRRELDRRHRHAPRLNAGRGSNQRAPHAKRGGVFFAVVPSVASGCSRVPNWSLERTSTGKALGPRGAQAYHAPRGPSALPVVSAQLKR